MTNVVFLVIASAPANPADLDGHAGNLIFLLVLALLAIGAVVWWLKRQV